MNTVFKHQYANYQMHNLANGDWITLLTPVPYKVIRSERIMWMVYLNVMHRIHYNSEQTFTAKLRNFIDIYTSHRIYHKCTHAYNSNNDKNEQLYTSKDPKKWAFRVTTQASMDILKADKRTACLQCWPSSVILRLSSSFKISVRVRLIGAIKKTQGTSTLIIYVDVNWSNSRLNIVDVEPSGDF